MKNNWEYEGTNFERLDASKHDELRKYTRIYTKDKPGDKIELLRVSDPR